MSGPLSAMASGIAVAAACTLLTPRACRRLARATGATPARPAGAVRQRWAAVRARTRPAGAGADRSPSPTEQVATAAGELAALLRAGAGPVSAWAQHLPLAPAGATTSPDGHRPGSAPVVAQVLARAARAADEGGDVAAVLTGPCQPAAREALAALAAAWRLAERTGAPTAELLDRVAAGLRADAEADDARQAALAAPRATARVLLALPLLGLVLGGLLGAHPLHVLVATAPGRWCALGGAVCTAAGWVWTRTLLRLAEGGG